MSRRIVHIISATRNARLTSGLHRLSSYWPGVHMHLHPAALSLVTRPCTLQCRHSEAAARRLCKVRNHQHFYIISLPSPLFRPSWSPTPSQITTVTKPHEPHDFSAWRLQRVFLPPRRVDRARRSLCSVDGEMRVRLRERVSRTTCGLVCICLRVVVEGRGLMCVVV
jgi:hypothetical protein